MEFVAHGTDPDTISAFSAMAIDQLVRQPSLDGVVERRRSLSSGSNGSNDKDFVVPPSAPTPSSRLSKKQRGKEYTPDRCKLCLRHFSRLLQCKQCCNCKKLVCALCVLKIPMFHSEKSKLGKHALHARLCASCYDTNILNQSSNSDSSENDGDSTALDSSDENGTFILVDESEPSTDSGGSPRESHTELWLSLFTAALLFGTSLLEDLEYMHRAGAMALLYVLFMLIHPAWSRHGASSDKPSQLQGPIRRTSSTSNASDDLSTGSPAETTVVPLTIDDYRQRKTELMARFEELKVSTAWVKNEAKSKGAVSLFEIDSFIADVAAEDMLKFLSSADPAVRKKWDTGMAANEIVDTIALDDSTTAYVVHNTQKPHGFGLVSSRDFVLLAFQHGTALAFVQGVIDRPDIPVKAGVMRGKVHFISFEFEPTTSADGTSTGFRMTYINHVDIGGSVPKSLVANGTADNMVKMMNMCMASKKKWFS
ncbi:hypothetical protein DYB32_002649 [Aphanomyces invadans]|uniref:START domain-containing protein n=1 Tax=Aphanomyces invadans TaxID=157072 RepID=A0A3R7D3R8_9STRA|nr:hypothetical protein DYB32_002649 [Aphanomyces invadans]